MRYIDCSGCQGLGYKEITPEGRIDGHPIIGRKRQVSCKKCKGKGQIDLLRNGVVYFTMTTIVFSLWLLGSCILIAYLVHGRTSREATDDIVFWVAIAVAALVIVLPASAAYFSRCAPVVSGLLVILKEQSTKVDSESDTEQSSEPTEELVDFTHSQVTSAQNGSKLS